MKSITPNRKPHEQWRTLALWCLGVVWGTMDLPHVWAGERLIPGTLCQQSEQVVFSCPLRGKAKIVSLCGAKNLSATEGYLSYRFGTAKRIELVFPPDQHETQQRFRYAHYLRYQVNRTSVSFTNDEYTYTLFDSYDGEQTPAVREQGVQVSRTGTSEEEVTLLCRAPVRGSLGRLGTVVPCDPNDPLNMGDCP